MWDFSSYYYWFLICFCCQKRTYYIRLKGTKIYFMVQHRVSFDKFSICTWKELMMFVIGWTVAPKLIVLYFLETYVTLYDVLVRFFTETELIGCVCVCKVIERERDFKELGLCNCRGWKIQNLQGSWQAGDLGESRSLSPKAICWQNSLFFEGGWYFSIKALMDWMRPIHITEGNPFHSKSTDSNDNLI